MVALSQEHDTAGVVAHPPLLYLGALAVGCGIEALYPLAGGLLFSATPLFVAGCIAFAAGAVLLVASAHRFVRAGTNVPTNRPSTLVVTEGLYRYSRNPIYIGLTLIYIALALLLNAIWALALLPAVLVVMHYGVILREEAYLAKKFPNEYETYRARVRRWL
jgi:protein-S-isoprenylcysteine O-methyltransferase Ste14